MKGRLGLSVSFILAFLILRLYSYEGHEIYFDSVQYLFLGLSVATMGRYWIRNRGRSKGQVLMELVEQKLGRAYANYLLYELRLFAGLFHFIRAPVRNYRAVMKSYFATEKLKAVFIAILLIMVLETGLIHLLISDQVSGTKALILHAVIVISEIYLCEILIGNLYHLQHSVVMLDERFHFKMGIMWDLNVPIEVIDRVASSPRVPGDRTPKLALMHDELVRIHFKRKVSATKHFRTISLDQADVFLHDGDQKRLQEALQRRSQAAGSASGPDPGVDR